MKKFSIKKQLLSLVSDIQDIYSLLNDFNLRLSKLEIKEEKPNSFDKPIYGRTDVHSQMIREIAHYVNSVEIIPGDKHSITINIEVK